MQRHNKNISIESTYYFLENQSQKKRYTKKINIAGKKSINQDTKANIKGTIKD